MTLPAPTPASLERLTHCPDCGYSLEGLPHAHRCPECGFLPEPGLVVLWGWSGPRSGQGLSRPNRGWSRHMGLLYFAAVMLGYGFSRNYFAVAAIALCIFIPWLYYTLRLRSAYTRPTRPLQLRLSPNGIGQRIGFGPVLLRPWSNDTRIELTPLANDGLLLSASTESTLGITTLRLCDIETTLPPGDQRLLHDRLTAWLTPLGARISRLI